MTLRNPKWVDHYLNASKTLSDEVFAELNRELAAQKPGEPVASVVMPVWNEEEGIVPAIWSLAAQRTKYPYEIIVLDNNSTDRTWELLQRMNINSIKQPIQGVSPSRQIGQQTARGKYILLADADCVYPADWLDALVDEMENRGAVGVLGRFTFIGDENFPRWQLYLYDLLKMPLWEFRYWRRPYLVAAGATLGFVKKLGLEIGFWMDRRSGSDGWIIMNLMKYGKIRRLPTSRALVWTSYRALLRDGSLAKGFAKRVVRELVIIRDYFFPKNIVKGREKPKL